MSKPLLVHAIGLSSFLSPNDSTWIPVRNKFVERKGRDTLERSPMLAEAQFVNVSSKDVIAALDDLLRYRFATEELYFVNRQGKKIPKFRVLLLRGLANGDGKDLEQKIMLEGTDFSDDEYVGFKSAIKKYGVSVEEGQVARWLRHSVLAPHIWEDFSKLVALNPEFGPIAESYGKPVGYYASYNFYKKLRAAATSAVSNRLRNLQALTEGSQEKKQPYSPRYQSRFRPELDAILARFADRVESVKVPLVVVSVRELEQNVGREANGHHGSSSGRKHHLRTGFYTGELDAQKMSMEEVREEVYLIQVALSDGISQYIRHKNPEQFWGVYSTLGAYIRTKLLPRDVAGQTVLNINLRQANENRPAVFSGLDQMYQDFMRDVREGAFDCYFGAAPHTFVTGIDTLNFLNSVLPRTYFEFLKLHIESRYQVKKLVAMKSAPRRERRQQRSLISPINDRISQLERYLRETYSMFHEDRRILSDDVREAVNSGTLRLPDEQPQRDSAILAYKKAMEARGTKYYTRGDAKTILQQSEVSDLIKFYDRIAFLIDLAVSLRYNNPQAQSYPHSPNS